MRRSGRGCGGRKWGSLVKLERWVREDGSRRISGGSAAKWIAFLYVLTLVAFFNRTKKITSLCSLCHIILFTTSLKLNSCQEMSQNKTLRFLCFFPLFYAQINKCLLDTKANTEGSLAFTYNNNTLFAQDLLSDINTKEPQHFSSREVKLISTLFSFFHRLTICGKTSA